MLWNPQLTKSQNSDHSCDHIMSHTYFITGGAGFIGSNLAARLLNRGERVIIYDNLSRSGAEANREWLGSQGKGQLLFIRGELEDFPALCDAIKPATCIYHLAGQVAVTTSVADPIKDFSANALGTLHVLEAARKAGTKPIILYSSTNKVYGGMEERKVVLNDGRYAYSDAEFGIPETEPLDFHSPYGCSKGAADQYVRDYARIFGLRTVVFRQSCIYGYRQFGVEDQGWVAWFIIAALKDRPISIYGDGRQVRDVLFIEDLLDAYDLAVERIERTAGGIYNIGGGPQNTMSVWSEFGPILNELLGRSAPVRFADWRPGDQRIYISDIRKAASDLGWSPRISVKEGIGRLFNWIRDNQELFSHL